MCRICDRLLAQLEDARRRGNPEEIRVREIMLEGHQRNTCQEQRGKVPALSIEAEYVGVWPGGKKAYVRKG